MAISSPQVILEFKVKVLPKNNICIRFTLTQVITLDHGKAMDILTTILKAAIFGSQKNTMIQEEQVKQANGNLSFMKANSKSGYSSSKANGSTRVFNQILCIQVCGKLSL